MASKRFDALFKSKPTAPEDESFVQQQIDEFKAYLSELYKLAVSSLSDYTDGGQVNWTYHTRGIFEQVLGSYEVPMMKIEFAGHEVLLTPLGTMFIGAKGRVDMVGSDSEAKLLLIHKNSLLTTTSEEEFAEQSGEWVWVIWKEPLNNGPKFLDKNAFLDALAEVSGG